MADNAFLKWMTQETETIFWHDSAVHREQQDGFSNGAVGMTTNPFLINATLRNDTGFWKERLQALPRGLTGDQKVEALVHCVTGYFAHQVQPFYGPAGKGYVCAQTNPNKIGDAGYMIAQAQALAAWAPNIVVKLPATRAGIEAYEECTALGLNVAATVSFTVPQVLAVGEARAKGKKRAQANGVTPGLAIAVMMVGRLDDYMRDVAQDSCPSVTEGDVVYAGIACIKRAYEIFNQRGYDAYLMPAGCRGAHHITEIAGAKMICSIAPKIQELLLSVERFEPRIDAPVDAQVIDRLRRMPEFSKAYEPDGMEPQEFIAYGATNRTTSQFVECGWNPILAFDYEAL